MKKPTLTTVSSGYYSSTSLTDNFDAIETAFENTLSLDGSTPNAMQADLDLNNNDLLNVGALDASSLTLAGIVLTTANLAQVAPWAWRDAWVTSTSYKVNDLTRQDGNVYICVTAHTSGTFSTDLSGGLWDLFAPKGTSGSGSGDLLAANNLGDLNNVATARTNLGLRVGVEVQAQSSELDALDGTGITGVSGTDNDVITGTAGTDGDLATWNADGDLVDGPSYGTSGANNLLQLDSEGKLPPLDGGNLTGLDSYYKDVQTFASSGTWTKPSGLLSTDLAMVHVVGGGQAGSISSAGGAGGMGGAGFIFTVPVSELASTVDITVGIGGSGSSLDPGRDTTFGADTDSYYALAKGGGSSATTIFGKNAGGYDGVTPEGADFGTGGTGGTSSTAGGGATYGGGGGGGSASNATFDIRAGGNSVYAGRGGHGADQGATQASQEEADGKFPGGGGGSKDTTNAGGYHGAGASGWCVVKIIPGA